MLAAEEVVDWVSEWRFLLGETAGMLSVVLLSSDDVRGFFCFLLALFSFFSFFSFFSSFFLCSLLAGLATLDSFVDLRLLPPVASLAWVVAVVVVVVEVVEAANVPSAFAFLTTRGAKVSCLLLLRCLGVTPRPCTSPKKR